MFKYTTAIKKMSSKANAPCIGATCKRKGAQLLACLIAYIYHGQLVSEVVKSKNKEGLLSHV
jgi:hypothetical protein